MDEELLSALRYELGEVTGWEELCPGVYSLTVQPDSDSVRERISVSGCDRDGPVFFKVRRRKGKDPLTV